MAKLSRPVPYIKNYRLQQLGIAAPLTALQKAIVAKKCHCTTEYVEMCISEDYQCISYNVYIAIAHEIGNKIYIAKYGRKGVSNA